MRATFSESAEVVPFASCPESVGSSRALWIRTGGLGATVFGGLRGPKGFFGIKERTLSIGNQFDQEGQLISGVRPVGRLRSSTGRVGSGARPSGSAQERAATSGSARLIFSSTGRVDSGASCDQRVGSTLQLVWDSAEFSRLSGLDSSGSPSPLQAGKTRLTAQLGLRGSTSAESEVSLQLKVAVWRRGDDPTLHAASELWAPPTDRVPNYDSVSTGIQPIPHGDRGATDTYDAHRPLTTRPPGVCLT
ncbi:unnamed protein product [Lampetra planeri]